MSCLFRGTGLDCYSIPLCRFWKYIIKKPSISELFELSSYRLRRSSDIFYHSAYEPRAYSWDDEKLGLYRQDFS